MNSENLTLRGYLDGLMQSGRYHFTPDEVVGALRVSSEAAKVGLHRLRRKGEIAHPARGFYVIVPPEYRSLECLPADQFIPALMKHLGARYYAGLLSAAQYHGAAHHRPQELQVMVESPRRALVCGKVRVAFFQRSHLTDVPTQEVNTPRGPIRISTPEATALDLVGYASRIGGLDAVATLLVDLADRIDAKQLLALAPAAPLPWVQRLGRLLDTIDASAKAASLRAYVKSHARDFTPLLPSANADSAPRDETWKVIVNAEVEADA